MGRKAVSGSYMGGLWYKPWSLLPKSQNSCGSADGCATLSTLAAYTECSPAVNAFASVALRLCVQGAADSDGLAAAAAATLLRRYQEEASARMPLVQELLHAQGLTGKAGELSSK